MSRRIISILREEAVDVEQYSIDEAFIFPPTTAAAAPSAPPADASTDANGLGDMPF